MQTAPAAAQNTVVKFGAVAIQQALVLGLGLTFRRAAALAQVNLRTLSNHVAAKKGSNVAAWGSRTADQQAAAIQAARALVAAADAPRYDFYFAPGVDVSDPSDWTLAWSSLTADQVAERASANIDDPRRQVYTCAGTLDVEVIF